MIVEVVCCSWCHAAVYIYQRPQWCPACGHRADLARIDCDCPGCLPAVEDRDADFAADLARLLERGYVAIEQLDADTPPRFRPTAIAAASDPTAALADLVDAALERGDPVDELIDALIEARATEEEAP